MMHKESVGGSSVKLIITINNFSLQLVGTKGKGQVEGEGRLSERIYVPPTTPDEQMHMLPGLEAATCTTFYKSGKENECFYHNATHPILYFEVLKFALLHLSYLNYNI